MALSKSQIDRLGERLKAGDSTDNDLRMLDEYRRSFGHSYDAVVETIRKTLGAEPTGRPAKSTQSIVDKLRRESVRLSQIQDIAGCRLVVVDVAAQDNAMRSLIVALDGTSLVDRRVKPSHGYRAVHLVTPVAGNFVEIQIRTLLQHLWAELSEKLSDLYGISIKYGGGEKEVRETLDGSSRLVAGLEDHEKRITRLPDGSEKAQLASELAAIREDYRSAVQRIIEGAKVRDDFLD